MKKYLVGNSVDIHKIKKEKNKITLGGIKFLQDYVIVAFSDGDIIFHAIAEAILGALALGDLGDHFSDSNPKNHNMDSRVILDYVLDLMTKQNYHISNIDLTIISEHIIMKNLKPIIKNNLIELLKTNQVSIKATRWEEDKMFIQCNCIVLLEKD